MRRPVLTLQDQFDAYIRSCYPDPPAADHPNAAVRNQYQQLRDAFFAGCLVAYVVTSDFSAELRQYGAHIKLRKNKPETGVVQ